MRVVAIRRNRRRDERERPRCGTPFVLGAGGEVKTKGPVRQFFDSAANNVDEIYYHGLGNGHQSMLLTMEYRYVGKLGAYGQPVHQLTGKQAISIPYCIIGLAHSSKTGVHPANRPLLYSQQKCNNAEQATASKRKLRTYQ